jgi:hypothetical protein
LSVLGVERMKDITITFMDGTFVSATIEDICFWRIVEPSNLNMIKIDDHTSLTSVWVNPRNIKTVHIMKSE